MNCTVSFSGIIAMAFFGTALLSSAGFSPTDASLANCLVGLAGTIAILIQAITIDKVYLISLKMNSFFAPRLVELRGFPFLIILLMN